MKSRFLTPLSAFRGELKPKFYIFLIFTVCFTFIFLSSCAAKTPEIPQGAKTLDGSFRGEGLPIDVGYVLKPDGFGYQILGDISLKIRYYILDGKIFIETMTEEKLLSENFDFYEGDGYIEIAGMRYNRFEDNNSSLVN